MIGWYNYKYELWYIVFKNCFFHELNWVPSDLIRLPESKPVDFPFCAWEDETWQQATMLDRPGRMRMIARRHLGVSKKFYKIFQIPCHIESLDVCMEY